jgi:hypothetical protein
LCKAPFRAPESAANDRESSDVGFTSGGLVFVAASTVSQGLLTRFTSGVEPDERLAALRLLDGLKIRADRWKPPSKYDRKALPLAWRKLDARGLDTKDYVLARELTDKVYDSDGFTLRYGLPPEDCYTGEPIEFRQAEDKANWRIELDHIVSLSDAFTSGGHRWKPNGWNWGWIATDTGNLLPITRTANRDKNAASWLPRQDFQARFVILQVQVKARYRLSVTESEAAAFRAVLSGQ